METAKELITMGYQIAMLIAFILGLFWTWNKLFLSAVYISKKEFKEWIDNHSGVDKSYDSKINSLEKDFAVYKSEQHGVNELLKLQMTQFSDMMKVYFSQMVDMKTELLHQINNIPNKMVTAEKFMTLEDKVNHIEKQNAT